VAKSKTHLAVSVYNQAFPGGSFSQAKIAAYTGQMNCPLQLPHDCEVTMAMQLTRRQLTF